VIQTPVTEREDAVITTGLEYRPCAPVRVHVVHRWHRTTVDDGGAAVELAGRPAGWSSVGERLARELGVNVSRGGIVSLPVVRVGPPEHEVVRRIAEASRALFQELLELAA
jgi:hypothetical protein